MKEFQIFKDILMAKNNNKYLYDLIIMFNPLMKKYATLLFYEDAYYDLQMDFIEFIVKFDLDKMEKKDNNTLLSYIHKVIKSCFTKRIKTYSEYCFRNYFFAEITDEQFLINRLTTVDTYENLIKNDYQKYLTNLEYEVLLMIYYSGYTVTEISKIKNVLRQSVNQIKLKAIDKLRNNFKI